MRFLLHEKFADSSAVADWFTTCIDQHQRLTMTWVFNIDFLTRVLTGDLNRGTGLGWQECVFLIQRLTSTHVG